MTATPQPLPSGHPGHAGVVRAGAAAALVLWSGGCLAGALGVLAWSAPWAVATVRRPALAGLDDLLSVLAAAALVAVLAMGSLSAVVAAAAAGNRSRAARGSRPPGVPGRAAARLDALERAVVPVLVRRLAGAALGAGVATGLAAPAALASAALASAPVVPAPVVPAWPAEGAAWGQQAPPPAPAAATPTTAPTAPSPPTPAPVADPPPPADGGDGREVVVRPGDTLWAIAEQSLPPGAPDAQVAAEWPRWWAANRAVVGADPDLLLPGQVLHPPGGRS